MKIIGFVGPKGSGKDTAADLLDKAGRSKGKISFAGPLKEICAKIYNIPIQTLNDPVLKEKKFVDMKNFGKPIILTSRSLKDIKKELQSRLKEYSPEDSIMKYNVDKVAINGIEGQSMESPRQLMQVVGTDFIRERVYGKWHMEAAFADENLAKLTKSGLYCVTDVRFPNELEFLQNKFGSSFECYYVERPEAEKILAAATHASETGVKLIREMLPTANIIKNDGSLDDLKKKLEKLKDPVDSQVAGAATPGKKSKFVYGPRN